MNNRNTINISLLGLSLFSGTSFGQLLPKSGQSDYRMATPQTTTSYSMTLADYTTSTDATQTLADYTAFTDVTSASQETNSFVLATDLPDLNDELATRTYSEIDQEQNVEETQKPGQEYSPLPVFNKADQEGDTEAEIAYDFSDDGIVDDSKKNADFYTKSEGSKPLMESNQLDDEQSTVPQDANYAGEDVRFSSAALMKDSELGLSEEQSYLDEFDQFTKDYIREYNVLPAAQMADDDVYSFGDDTYIPPLDGMWDVVDSTNPSTNEFQPIDIEMNLGNVDSTIEEPDTGYGGIEWNVIGDSTIEEPDTGYKYNGWDLGNGDSTIEDPDTGYKDNGWDLDTTYESEFVSEATAGANVPNENDDVFVSSASSTLASGFLFSLLAFLI